MNRTTEDERDEIQGLFDTAYWTRNANHQLSPDTEISLATKLPGNLQRPVYHTCKVRKWLVELKAS